MRRRHVIGTMLIGTLVATSVIVFCAKNGTPGGTDEKPGGGNETPGGGDEKPGENPDKIIPNESPIVLGYFTNWGVYAGNPTGAENTGGFQVKDIPPYVDEILYSFAQIGDCQRVKDATHPLGYATETDPTYCKPLDRAPQIITGRQDWMLHATDPYSDYKYQPDDPNYDGLNNIGKMLAKSKPVLLSIGGWSLSPSIRQVIKPERRTQFIQSIIDFLNPNKPINYLGSYSGAQNRAKAWNGGQFSGVDIDWEPNGNMWTLNKADQRFYVPVTKQDLVNFKAFLSELKTALTQAKLQGLIKNDILRIATTANPDAVVDVDKTYGGQYWKELSTILTSLSVMTYDYHGEWDEKKCTAFNAALYNDQRAATECGYDPKWSMEGSIAAYVNAGVPRLKLMGGVPTYGRTYIVANTNNAKPYKPWTETYYNKNGEDLLPNRAIYTGAFEGTSLNSYFVPNITNDPVAGQNYTWSTITGGKIVFLTLDNAATAKNKMQYVSQQGLQGVIVWSLDGDVLKQDDPSSYNTNSVFYGLYQGVPVKNSGMFSSRLK